MKDVVKDYPGTYDPNVMEELRKKGGAPFVLGTPTKYESVHQVAIPFHREAKLFGAAGKDKLFNDCCTPYDSTDYYASLYPLMGYSDGGGWTDCQTLSEWEQQNGACNDGRRWIRSGDFWHSVLECFDEVRTKSFILLIVAVLSPPEIWKSDGGCWECHS